MLVGIVKNMIGAMKKNKRDDIVSCFISDNFPAQNPINTLNREDKTLKKTRENIDMINGSLLHEKKK